MRWPEFTSPRWRKERKWKWGGYEDHVTQGSDPASRASYRAMLTLTTREPVAFGHHVGREGWHTWGLHLIPDRTLGLGISRAISGGGSGPEARNVTWYDWRLKASLLGVTVDLVCRQPRWEESREDFLADRALARARRAIATRAMDGCTGVHYHSLRAINPRETLPLPERVELVGGVPTLIRPVGYVPCREHGNHYVWPDDDPDGWIGREYSADRYRRQKEEARELEEVSKALTSPSQ